MNSRRDSSSVTEGRFAVLVLAAGRGTRMGGPKALMTVGGEVWWRRQCESIRAGVNARTILVVSLDVRAEIVRQCEHHGWTVPEMVNADPLKPMMASVLAGMACIFSDHADRAGSLTIRGVFVLPIDAPAPGAAVWRSLAQQTTPACPSIGTAHGHPIFLPEPWLLRKLFPLLSDPSADDRERLDLLIGSDRTFVRCEDPLAVMNLNTPADVQRFEAMRDGRR